MSRKNKSDKRGFVYSTDPNFQYEHEHEESETLAPAQQKLRVSLDAKQRGGKLVTILEGFSGKASDLEDLGKKLRTACGTGGSAKDGYILVQGDQRDRMMDWLRKNGYAQVKRT